MAQRRSPSTQRFTFAFPSLCFALLQLDPVLLASDACQHEVSSSPLLAVSAMFLFKRSKTAPPAAVNSRPSSAGAGSNSGSAPKRHGDMPTFAFDDEAVRGRRDANVSPPRSWYRTTTSSSLRRIDHSAGCSVQSGSKTRKICHIRIQPPQYLPTGASPISGRSCTASCSSCSAAPCPSCIRFHEPFACA